MYLQFKFLIPFWIEGMWFYGGCTDEFGRHRSTQGIPMLAAPTFSAFKAQTEAMLPVRNYRL